MLYCPSNSILHFYCTSQSTSSNSNLHCMTLNYIYHRSQCTSSHTVHFILSFSKHWNSRHHITLHDTPHHTSSRMPLNCTSHCPCSDFIVHVVKRHCGLQETWLDFIMLLLSLFLISLLCISHSTSSIFKMHLSTLHIIHYVAHYLNISLFAVHAAPHQTSYYISLHFTWYFIGLQFALNLAFHFTHCCTHVELHHFLYDSVGDLSTQWH